MTDRVQIGDHRWIGPGEPTFVIAEVGSNHNQELDQAKRLIQATADAGADAVKFQLFSADILYPGGGEIHAAFRAVELSRDWVPELADYSRERGLLFLASAFDEGAVDCLEAVGSPAHKVASSETTNLPLLKYMASKQKPILMSTGMCDLADIFEAVEVVHSEKNTDIALFQCTTLYPTEPRHSHLRVMDTLRSAFQAPVGLSDHTLDIVVPVAAVARGACMIEKTLTLGRDLPGPDHGYSLEPNEFKKMVEAIRITEEALGSPVKTMLPEEAQVARRDSIRAARDILPGELLTEEMLTLQRPALGGIRPRAMAAVLGRRAKQPISRGEAIKWDMI